MKALFAKSSIRHKASWFVLLLGFVWGTTLVGCDFNVEITDEKRSLEKIGGTSPCESGQRFSTGNSGTHTLRLFLIDDRQTPEALDLKGIDLEPFNLKADVLEVAGDSAAPKVIDAEDGTDITGVKATISIVKDGTDALIPVPNPRYYSLRRISDNKRVPKAVNLLIDMSETAADSDSSLSRTSAPAGWILENFNTDTTVGDFDIFSTLFVRGGVVNRSDLLFIDSKWEDDIQYFAEDGKRRGFIRTTSDAKERISQEFTNISNAKVSGQPPAYAAIQAAAADTRLVSRSTESESSEPLFNPGLIFITLERDHFLLDNKQTDSLPAATKELAGSSWEYPAEDAAEADFNAALDKADFIPLMSVVYPAPEVSPGKKLEVKEWDQYLDGLCQLARATSPSNRKAIYWGQLFQVTPHPRRSYQNSTRANLDLAYHALKGYVQIKVNYQLSGTEANKRYLVAFKLQGTLLEQQSNVDDSPLIVFEVRTN